MPETLTADRRTSTRRSPAPFIWAALAVVIGVVVVAWITSLTQTPERLDELTVVNPTSYELTLSVDTDEGSRLIGQVPADTTYPVLDVIDQGERWDVNFSTQGVDAGSATFERTGDGSTFEITVPDEVGQRLADAGVIPAVE